MGGRPLGGPSSFFAQKWHPDLHPGAIFISFQQIQAEPTTMSPR